MGLMKTDTDQKKEEVVNTAAVEQKERMNIVVVGHVDHGKSTVIGRLLADTDSLPEGKLEAIKQKCEASGKRLEYAFLLDALADEQAQGITIDAARIFFETEARYYIIIDAPGHIEFLKNMITGASHAEAALLVIDAEQGVQENSRRHGYMLSLLGVKQVIVLVNKMDLVKYSKDVFESIVEEYGDFLDSVLITPLHFIPVSGLEGDNITSASKNMEWYKGSSVLDSLDALHRAGIEANETLRMFVQDVYKFTRFGDDRRIVAGTVLSGNLSVGDKVSFFPSGKSSFVESIELFSGGDPQTVTSGEAVGITLAEQLYLKRGEIVTRSDETRPRISTRIKVSLFWLGQEAMVKNKDYFLKVGTAKVRAQIEEITRVIDAGSLDANTELDEIPRNAVAECLLKLNSAIAFDEVDFSADTGRFVIVDDFRIMGGGIIREGLEDSESTAREGAIRRNQRWIHSLVSPRDRAVKYNQRAVLLLITGDQKSDRKGLGKALEARLFEDGKLVYFLGIGSMVYGLDADIEGREDIGSEHIRRLAELANIMLDSGMMLIVSAAELSRDDLALVRALVGTDTIKSIWLGDSVEGSNCDLHLPESDDFDSAINQIKDLLYSSNIIFRPW